MKKPFVIAVLAATMAIPAVSHAVDITGKWGLGYFRPEAPIGARIWAGDKVGIDLGVGFVNTSPDVGDGNTSYNIDLGLPYVIHNGDNVLFFLRPGLLSSSNGVDEDKGSNVTTYNISGSLGVEYFFTPSFSLQVAHGVYFESANTKNNTDPLNHIDRTDSEFASEPFGISNIGFHYYFGGETK